MDSALIKITCYVVLFLFALYGILIAVFGKRVLHLQLRSYLVVHIAFAWLATRQVFWGINIPASNLNIYDLRTEALLMAGILWAFSLFPLLIRSALLTKDKDKPVNEEESND